MKASNSLDLGVKLCSFTKKESLAGWGAGGVGGIHLDINKDVHQEAIIPPILSR